MSPQSANLPPIAPIDVPDAASPPTGRAGGAPAAAPSAFEVNGSGPGPSLAVAHYNPRTGSYVAPNGQLYWQTDLATPGAPKKWQDMLPT